MAGARYGRWEALRLIGGGAQGEVYLAADTVALGSEDEILDAIQKSVWELASSGPPSPSAQGREQATRLLGALEKHVARRDPKLLGAVKVVSPKVRDDVKAGQRMEREVAVLGRQVHPHIVRVLDADVAAGWFAMTYYPAGNLEKQLERDVNRCRGQPLEALRAVRPLVDAVAVLHQRGIVHRDITLRNIFVADHGLVLGDFGLVYDPDAGERITGSYENVGTWLWMPVWAMGRRQQEPTPAFDVVALGKLFWVLVSGHRQPPFPDHRAPEFDLERQFPGDLVMKALNALLDRCLAREEKDVLPSALELRRLADALIDALERGGHGPERPRRGPLDRDRAVALANALTESA